MKEVDALVSIMKMLRSPFKGCPWDFVQDEHTLKEYIVEEAYELVEAIDLNDAEKQKEELGDLLLQIIFLSQINNEKGFFRFKDVADGLISKLVDRHPHVFKDVHLRTEQEVRANWQATKKREKNQQSILSEYPAKMPSLMKSKRISEQAASVGFDWSNPLQAIKKVEEELDELKVELGRGDKNRIHEELGDLFFALANVARLLNINPEMALDSANKKFVQRFRVLEERVRKSGEDIHKMSLEKLEKLWQDGKKT